MAFNFTQSLCWIEVEEFGGDDLHRVQFAFQTQYLIFCALEETDD